MEKRPALGKGLSALIPDVSDALLAPRVPLEVDLDLLEPNRDQPRFQMDEARLDELARSIVANGLIQPIVVSCLAGGRYQIIAGERRWRAAQRAGLLKVPVTVKEIAASDRRRLLEMALVENIQREDLNAIEAAQAFQRLIDEFDLRQEDIAAEIGKDRSTVANHLRLLKLPEEVRAEIAAGRLSMGHARAIVALSSDGDQRRVAREVIARALTVRDTEALVKKTAAGTPAAPPPTPPIKDVHTRAAEEPLRRALGTRVEIVRKGKGGHLAIAFASEDELQRLFERLTQ
jgi:ParB family chromosome partitioning protein